MKAALAIVLLALLAVTGSAGSEPPPGFVARMADAVYTAEGGPRTRYPYGVKSIKTTSIEHARRITIDSINNNWRRWEAAGKPEPFVKFMARRWCPLAADPVGHVNWVRNVNAILGKEAL